ncbi:hypothetical protein EB838_15655 [Klebsiella pneumoniae]|nr:hypothetical protein EB838_15655 [Klebsiella pneumoniae]
MAVLPSIFDSSLTLIIYAKYKRLLNKAFYKKGPWCPRAGQHSAAPFAHTAWNSFILCVISVNAQRQMRTASGLVMLIFCVIVLE